MPLEHHPLSREFPEYLQQLRALHASDAHFARQTEAYEALDKRICRIEDGIETLDGDALSLLKQDRVTLKDDLARQLKRAAGQCCGCGNGCGG